MFYSYTPKGTCSHQIEFEIDNGILKNVSFAGGCNGNLKALTPEFDPTGGKVLSKICHKKSLSSCPKHLRQAKGNSLKF